VENEFKDAVIREQTEYMASAKFARDVKQRRSSFDFKRHETTELQLDRRMSQNFREPANPDIVKYDNEMKLKEKLSNRKVRHSLADVLNLARQIKEEQEKNNPSFNKYGKPTSVFA